VTFADSSLIPIATSRQPGAAGIRPACTRRHGVIADFPDDRGGDGRSADPPVGVVKTASITAGGLHGLCSEVSKPRLTVKVVGAKPLRLGRRGDRLLLMQFDLTLNLQGYEDTIASPQVVAALSTNRRLD
jgi:hypothetical protein